MLKRASDCSDNERTKGWKVLLAPRITSFGFLCTLLFVHLVAQSCGLSDRSFSQPTIAPNTEWAMMQKCGYESCGAKVDFLTGKDITIRIEADNDIPHAIQDRIFLVHVEFLSKTPLTFEYDPSQTAVRLPNGLIATAKGLPCPGTILDRSYMLATAPITGYQRVEKIDCFLLFFDVTPPRVDEIFTMNLLGLRRDGVRVEVPEIVFRPGR